MRNYKPKPGTKGLTRRGLIAFECPVCRRVVWVRKRQRGTVVGCGECTAEIRVPAAEGEEAEVVRRPEVPTSGPAKATIPERRRQAGEAGDGGEGTKGDSGRPLRPREKVGISQQSPEESTGKGEVEVAADSEGASREAKEAKGQQPAMKKIAPQPIGVGKKRDSSLPAGSGVEGKEVHRLNRKDRPKMRALDDVMSEGQPRPEWQVQDPHLADRLNMDEEVKRWTMVRLVTFGLAFFVVVGGLLAIFSFYGGRAEVAPDTNQQRAEWKTLTLDAEGAREVLESFLRAETIEEKMEYVRHPETTRRRMESNEVAAGPGGVEKLEVVEDPLTIRKFELEGVAFLGGVYPFSDLSQRGVVFENTPDGWKIDWESFVGYSEMPWDAFLETQPLEALTFRLLVRPDTYYNYGYTDEQAYSCYLLEDPTRNFSCWGYCDRGGEVDEALREAVAGAGEAGLPAAEAMLRLRFEERGQRGNQVWIDEFLRRGHLMP
ncbi:hypothetical protein BH23VER1_BH23VER1_15160 [soil metagenome]